MQVVHLSFNSEHKRRIDLRKYTCFPGNLPVLSKMEPLHDYSTKIVQKRSFFGKLLKAFPLQNLIFSLSAPQEARKGRKQVIIDDRL